LAALVEELHGAAVDVVEAADDGDGVFLQQNIEGRAEFSYSTDCVKHVVAGHRIDSLRPHFGRRVERRKLARLYGELDLIESIVKL
jgi:hypothetical protein